MIPRLFEMNNKDLDSCLFLSYSFFSYVRFLFRMIHKKMKKKRRKKHIMSEGILGWWYTARMSLITQILGILRSFFSQALLIYLLTAKKYEIDDCLTFHVEHWAIAVISSVAAMNCVQLYTLYMHLIGVFCPARELAYLIPFQRQDFDGLASIYRILFWNSKYIHTAFHLEKEV